MRLWSTGSVLALAIVGACRDESGLERDPNNASGALDAATSLDAQPRPARREDAAVDAGPPTLAAGQNCSAALSPPDEQVCLQPDPSEPNEQRAPAQLTLDPGCASLVARAADKDEDAFRFSTPKADPVSLELSYRDARRADLGFEVVDAQGQLVTRTDETRSADSEFESTIMLATAKAQYDLRVKGTYLGDCVAYALRVNRNWCTDAYEDNDSPARATQLAWNGKSVELEATSSRFEADYYEFTPEKADPVLITGSYEVDATSNLQLRRVLSNITGLNAIDAPGQRVGTKEEWRHWLRSDTPHYIVQIAASGDGCALYGLRIDATACTDAFEDNDGQASAAPLTPGQQLSANVFAGDDDFFSASMLAASGHCTLQYDVAPGSAQQLRIDVFSKTAGVIASAQGQPAPGGSQSVTVSWTDRLPSVLDVRAQLPDSCQSYRLRCDSDTGI
jgi:hypothetical protein